MTTKTKNIFTRSKPLMDIYSGIDHEGKQVEVREDAEQLVKWHEIADALVAAGYYRAQLQGLSAFDKIVGGLTWCIELCDIDVDISLLFEENLTIGKKIALTEKIVKVLPSMKCPYVIEPHQIQGLDFINIFPLIQWLIKYSSEFREAKEDELRKFAVDQYEKDYILESDRARFTKREQLLRNIALVQNLYKPCRVRKRNGPFPESELEQVNSVLSEYDQRMLMHVTSNTDEDNKDEGLDFMYDFERALADPSGATTATERYDYAGDENVEESKIHYAVLQSELTGQVSKEFEESEKIRYSLEIDNLNSVIDKMETEADDFKADYESKISQTKEQYATVISKLQAITDKLMTYSDTSDKDVKGFFKSLKELAKERKELLETIKAKESENSKLTQDLSNLKNPDMEIIEEPLSAEEQNEFLKREEKMNAYITNIRLELAQLNRDVLRYTLAIDEVPGPAELLQYEKRFMELYNQVAAKHKETKQYYIFFNTLYEVKLYTSKELSLLNSILDNYQEAMSSTRKREEFMTQFESIVEWVNQAVKKVELKYTEEKNKKTALHEEYSRLMDLQRQYAATLKRLAEQRHKYKDIH